MAGVCQHGFSILVGCEVYRDYLQHETTIEDLHGVVLRALGQYDNYVNITVQWKRRVRRQRCDPGPQIRTGKIRQVACMEVHPLSHDVYDFFNWQDCAHSRPYYIVFLSNFGMNRPEFIASPCPMRGKPQMVTGRRRFLLNLPYRGWS